MEFPRIDPKWRTATVVALCESMRQEDDFSALPILADALQDAGCDAEPLLNKLRSFLHSYVNAATLTAIILSAESEDAVVSLIGFPIGNDCPDYEVLVAAALGRHQDNSSSEYDPDNYSGYFLSENNGEHLHFRGRDAHGEIPPEFWDKIEIAFGLKIPDESRAKHFSCSC